mgnify:CR=1 FL=1
MQKAQAGSGSLGMINQLNQKKQNQSKTKTSNNQQIKGIMAAALASVKASDHAKNATPNMQS